MANNLDAMRKRLDKIESSPEIFAATLKEFNLEILNTLPRVIKYLGAVITRENRKYTAALNALSIVLDSPEAEALATHPNFCASMDNLAAVANEPPIEPLDQSQALDLCDRLEYLISKLPGV